MGRPFLGVLVVAAAVAVASAQFKNPIAQVYNTWDLNGEVKYETGFERMALTYGHEDVHQEEHSRRKRQTEEKEYYSTRADPITRTCERPGYTGQFCEFPICNIENLFVNPDQWETPTGFYIDHSLIHNCTREHKIIVDDTMRDIRIELEANMRVSPKFVLTNAEGKEQTPVRFEAGPTSYEATFIELRPGWYRIVPSSLNSAGHCVAISTARTYLTISGGFTQDGRDRNDFPSWHAGIHQFNTIILHANTLRFPGQLHAIEIAGPNNYIFRPRILDFRYNCMYEYYFDSMFCYEEGNYALTVEGTDHHGNIFRRSAPFLCRANAGASTVAPPSTPSPPPPTRCNHGGILLPRPDNGNNYCMCQDHWAGADCSVPMCINGGTLFSDDEGHECICPIGFHGLHCQEAHCQEDVEHGFGVDIPTVVLILRVRQQMNDVHAQIRKALEDVINNLAFDPEYLRRFHLVFFNNDKVTRSGYYSANEVLNILRHAENSTDITGGCTDTVFGSMASGLLQTGLTNKGMIYVVTDAFADDQTEYLETVYNWNSFWKATINFIYIDNVDTNCNNDLNHEGYRAFEELATRFDGLTWHIASRDDVYNVMFSHMDNLLFRTQLMLTADRRECSHGLLTTIDIERNNENIVIVAHGQDFYPHVTDPMGAAVDLEELLSHHGYFAIWRLKSPQMGQYIMKAVTSPATSSCSFRVYQAAYKAAGFRRQHDLFFAFTHDVDQDGYQLVPVVGRENHPVFHLTEMPPFENPDRIFSALTIYANRRNVEQEIYAANGIWRDACSYNFFFPPIHCEYPNELLHFNFYLRDSYGFYIQRGGSMFCYGQIPTFTPPSDCQNGGVLTSNGTCLCVPHFEGKHCEKPICEHGGTRFGEVCICEAGWAGLFCEDPRCHEQGPPPSYGRFVDMAFLVETTQRGIDQVKALAKVLPEILRDVTMSHRNWIDRLVLIGYNATSAHTLADVPAFEVREFIHRFNELANTTTTDQSCVVRTWEALRRLLRERHFGPGPRGIPRKSVINLYGTGIPDDFDGHVIAADISEELLRKYVTMNVFQGRNSDPTQGEWFCHGTEESFRLIEQAARRGNGHMYTLTNGDVAKAAFFIPTLFSSGIGYRYFFNDCTSPVTVFFPVDSHTQTVSAVIGGRNSNVTMSRYDGRPFPSTGVVEVFNGEGHHVVEFRRPCDEGWHPIQQNCVHFSPALGKVNYSTAAAKCETYRSYLIDDQTEDKNKWLARTLSNDAAWLGLVFQNGSWWFHHRHSYTPATQNYWAGGVVPNDPAKACAYFDPTSTNGYWKAASCSDTFTGVCQKHRFDNEHTPAAIGADDLSPGKYFFTVQTDPTPTGWKGCAVVVRLQSDLQVEYGVVDDIRKDDPVAFFNIDSKSNRVVSSISVGSFVDKESISHHVMIRSQDRNSTLLEAAPVAHRRDCTYDWYSMHHLSCEQTEENHDFDLVILGEDATGNAFQRYSTSFCTKYYFECLRGGVYSEGHCVCPEFITGDYCQTPICQNGGVLVEEAFCRCQEGYAGDACQYPMCPHHSNASFTNDDKTLVIVVESSTLTADIISQLATNLQKVVDAAHVLHPAWFTQYIVHSFTPDGVRDSSGKFGNVADAVKQLQSIAATSTQATKCEQPLYEALGDLFTMWSAIRGAEVLLITGATPLSNDHDGMFSTMEHFSTHSPVIDYIHVESPSCPVSSWGANLTHFGHFVHSTGGVLFRAAVNDFAKSMVAFVQTRYAPQKLTYWDHQKCDNGVFEVQIDTNMTEVYVSVQGPNPSIKAIAPKGEAVDFTRNLDTELTALYSFSPAYPGTYTITINSNSPTCFPSVWGNGGVQVIFGFLQDVHNDDFPTPYAVRGKFNYPVFHVVDPDNSRFIRGSLYYSNMLRWDEQGKDDSPYRSDTTLRVNCAYSYVGRAFHCPDDIDQALTLSVSGMDTFRQVFTRQIRTWCREWRGPSTTARPSPPPTSPLPSSAAPPATSTVAPPPSTAAPPVTTSRPLTPKELPFDVVFLVGDTENEFHETTAKPFILNVMSPYTVSQRHARVGLISLPSNPSQTMPVTFLSAIDSIDALDSNLEQFDDFIDVGSTEIVSNALGYAHYRYAKPSNGYRQGINNHLIVILTAKTTFGDLTSAVTEAVAILRDRSYGIMAIGYGANVDVAALISLAGGVDCALVAKDNTTLNGATATALQQRIWRAHNETNGVYCSG